MKLLGSLLLLAACAAGPTPIVSFLVQNDTIIATKFVAEGEWYTAQHAEPAGTVVGPDIVKIGVSTERGFSMCRAEHQTGESIRILLAPWPLRQVVGAILTCGRSEGQQSAFMGIPSFSGLSGSPAICGHNKVMGLVSQRASNEPYWIRVVLWRSL
jgi:hypothetical protein